MDGRPPPKPDTQTAPPAPKRQERLARDAAALRANLLKRKQQAAEREKLAPDRDS